VGKGREKKKCHILKRGPKQRLLDLRLERAMESMSRGKFSRSQKGNMVNGWLIKVTARNIVEGLGIKLNGSLYIYIHTGDRPLGTGICKEAGRYRENQISSSGNVRSQVL